MNITDKNTSVSSVTDQGNNLLSSYSDDEIKARYCFLVTQPLDLIMKEWLNEVVKARRAYAFIRAKGLYSEFLVFER